MQLASLCSSEHLGQMQTPGGTPCVLGWLCSSLVGESPRGAGVAPAAPGVPALVHTAETERVGKSAELWGSVSWPFAPQEAPSSMSAFINSNRDILVSICHFSPQLVQIAAGKRSAIYSPPSETPI